MKALSPRAAILAQRAKRRPRTFPYTGVALNVARGKYQAFVTIRGRRIHLGMWRDAVDAAIARDRGVLFFALDERLNLATISKPLGPESPERLRWLARRRGKEAHAASCYFGVTRNSARACWEASICIGRGRRVRIASFADAEEAALAYDRVVMWMFGRTRPLNFPDGGVLPASLEEVRTQARRCSSRAQAQCLSVGAETLRVPVRRDSFALAAGARPAMMATLRSHDP